MHILYNIIFSLQDVSEIGGQTLGAYSLHSKDGRSITWINIKGKEDVKWRKIRENSEFEL